PVKSCSAMTDTYVQASRRSTTMIEQERHARHPGVGAFVLVCALMVVSLPANAASGGSAQTGGHAKPTLTFNPTSVSVGDAYTVQGVGFPANTWVAVLAYFSHHAPSWGSAVTDGSGYLTASFTATASGRVRHVAKLQGNSGRFQ